MQKSHLFPLIRKMSSSVSMDMYNPPKSWKTSANTSNRLPWVTALVYWVPWRWRSLAGEFVRFSQRKILNVRIKF
jgi:hypothetical protein